MTSVCVVKGYPCFALARNRGLRPRSCTICTDAPFLCACSSLLLSFGCFGQEIGATQPLEFFDPLDLAEDDPCWQPIRIWWLRRPSGRKFVSWSQPRRRSSESSARQRSSTAVLQPSNQGCKSHGVRERRRVGDGTRNTEFSAMYGCLRRCHDGSCRCSRPALRGLAISC